MLGVKVLIEKHWLKRHAPKKTLDQKLYSNAGRRNGCKVQFAVVAEY